MIYEVVMDCIPNRFRPYIAGLLKKHYCWSDLVLWVVYGVSWENVSKRRGCGYCGECTKKEADGGRQ